MSEHAHAERATADDTVDARDTTGAGGTDVDVSETDELAVARATHSLTQQLEALLIVADEPLDAGTLAAAVARPVTEVREALAQLQAEYDGMSALGASAGPGTECAGDAGSGSHAHETAERSVDAPGSFAPRGFELREVPTGFRFYVRASLDPVVADFVQQERSARLSQAALETLAVIAYRQPVTRGQVAQIRAVNVDSVVRTLLSHGLVAEVGRHEETGATLYGTTAVLLDKLGINDIAELPHISPLLDDGAQGFEHEVL